MRSERGRRKGDQTSHLLQGALNSMCGIVGIVSWGEEIANNEQPLYSNSGGLTIVEYGLKMTWVLPTDGFLSSTFPPTGHQLMQSVDGRFVIIYNGELYNFNELRQGLGDAERQWQSNSDTEVILASYARWWWVAYFPLGFNDYRGTKNDESLLAEFVAQQYETIN